MDCIEYILKSKMIGPVCMFLLAISVPFDVSAAQRPAFYYKAIVERQFPRLQAVSRNQIELVALKQELPPEEWRRVGSNPGLLVLDLDRDGLEDFAVITKERGAASEEISIRLVACLQKKRNVYRCSILASERAGVPIWRYLDRFTVSPGEDCPQDFPMGKAAIGYFPTLGNVFSVFGFNRASGKYIKCQLGD